MNTEELKQQLEQAFKAEAGANFELAESLAKKALADLSVETEPALHSDALRLLGNVEGRRGNNLRALERLSAALASLDNTPDPLRRAKIHTSLGNVYKSLGSHDKALEYYAQALTLYNELGKKSGVVSVTGNIGTVYASLGSYDKALEYFAQALELHNELGEKSGVASVTGNIGMVYRNLGSYDKALENYAQSLALYNELREKSGVANLTGNIGGVHFSLGSYDKALEYYAQALALYSELGEKSGIARVMGNIGTVYCSLGSYDRALEYFAQSLALHNELGAKSSIAVVTGNIGQLYAMKDFDGNDSTTAEVYLLKAIALSEEIGAKQFAYAIHNSLAELYEKEERWKDSQIHYKKYHEIEKEVHSEEATKKAALLEQQKQIAEREKEIAFAKAAAAAKLNATTQLLHRVLPESVATRMIAGEKVADYFQNISILFADIVGFTPIAARMPAKSVLAFLNYVFGEFDRVMEKHGCQKIKTIGDGYMAVCGAPVECSDHAERLALAALGLNNDIQLTDDIRKSLPKGTIFHLRIGLHTGSAFAGIVGEKGFVYDVYSDAVNLAARMESSGEPGRIHCSEEFAMHLQNRDGADGISSIFRFEERGEIDIKGKGTMRTYFLERT